MGSLDLSAHGCGRSEDESREFLRQALVDAYEEIEELLEQLYPYYFEDLEASSDDHSDS
jgi:hypothetical protein